MPITALSDIIQPIPYYEYMVERTAEHFRFFSSGAVERDPTLDEKLAGGGRTVEIPFWQDLTGTPEVPTDTVSTTSGVAITAKDEVAVVIERNKTWAAADIAANVAGDDPIRAMADYISPYWGRSFQTIMVNILSGVLGASGMASALNDISTSGTASTGNYISAEAVIDTWGVLGDAADDLEIMVVHSAVYRRLQKLNLIDFIPDSDSKTQIPTYLGRRLIQADGVGTGTNGAKTTYTTYLVGTGAFRWGESMPKFPVEIERNSLAGNGGGVEYMTSRRRFTLHPRGMKWQGTISGSTVTDAELSTVTNWLRVGEQKNVKITALRTNG